MHNVRYMLNALIITIETAVLGIVHSGALGFKLEVNQIVTDGYSLWQSKFEKKVGDVDGAEDGNDDSDGDMVEIKKLIETEMWIDTRIRNGVRE
jgi:hypothetical protein